MKHRDVCTYIGRLNSYAVPISSTVVIDAFFFVTALKVSFAAEESQCFFTHNNSAIRKLTENSDLVPSLPKRSTHFEVIISL